MVKNELHVFNSPEFGEVRTVVIESEPWFVASDVCNILGLTNTTKAIQNLDNDERSNFLLGRQGNSNVINESGLYTLVIRSNKPEAKAFRKWVTSEVLPAIRRTGGYMAARADETPEEIMARALLVAQDTINRHKQRVQMLEGENEHLQTENRQLAPKATYTDEVLQSTSTYTMTEMAKELDMKSVYELEKKLKEKKIAFKQSGQWLLYAGYAGKGYTTTRTSRFFHKDGTPGTSTSTVWTERGRWFLHQTFGKGGTL